MPHIFFPKKRGHEHSWQPGKRAMGLLLSVLIATAFLIAPFQPDNASVAYAQSSCNGGSGCSAGQICSAMGCVTPATPTSPGGPAPVNPTGPSSPRSPVSAGVGSGVGGAAVCTIKLLGSLGAIAASPALAGAAEIATPPAVVAAGAGVIPVTGGTVGVASAVAANTLNNTGTTIASNVTAGVDLSNLFKNDFLDCMARALARAILQSITVSTVNWINSGFNGSPSFVQNPSQFFLGVGDTAVGNFLQSSDLAFLCSPFSLQIKIAITQAYAQNGPQQCSLTKVTNNITGFFNHFSQGGWPAFITMTTQPTNNPYGAYMQASIQLQTAVSNSKNQLQSGLNQSGGFLSIQQPQNCKIVDNSKLPPNSPNIQITPIQGPTQSGAPIAQSQVCQLVNITPGTAVAQQLDQTLGINTQSLETAKYFDEIISALVSQLIQQIQNVGLSGLSSGNGYGAGDTSTQTALVQNVEQNIPPYEQAAQEISAIDTQNISDIQSAILQVEGALASCGVSTTTATSTSSNPGIADLESNLATLNSDLAGYQQQFDLASSSLATLTQFQTELNSTTDLTTISNIVSDFTTKAADGEFLSANDYTNAQEDRINLQSQLAKIANIISTDTTECRNSGVGSTTSSFSR